MQPSVILVAAALALTCAAQTSAPDIEGGLFEIDGAVIDVTKDELARHFAFVRGFNPEAEFSRLYELAWSRALRVHAAKHAGLTVDAAAFQEWMARKHERTKDHWRRDDGGVDRDRFEAYMAGFGCSDANEYEALCRDEMLGELFAEREVPKVVADAEAVERRQRALGQRIALEVFVLAPETLGAESGLDRNDPANRELFASWWSSLSDEAKRRVDCIERPAVEAEVIYVAFDRFTQASFKDWFESTIPGTGTSHDALTADMLPDGAIDEKLMLRFMEQRTGSYAWLNREIAPGTPNEEAYFRVRPHLLREWRTITRMAQLYSALATGKEPKDAMRDVAARWGFEYERFPLAPTSTYGRQESGLPGDHGIHLMKTKPGELFRYRVINPELSIYFADGPVDQAGRHVSIWRVLRVEMPQVPTLEAAYDLAWSQFEHANAWRLSTAAQQRFETALEEISVGIASSRQAEIDAAQDDAEREAIQARIAADAVATAFNAATERAGAGRFLRTFWLRPFRTENEQPIYEGALGRRVLNALRLRWGDICPDPDALFHPGQVLPILRDGARSIILAPRVIEVRVPSDEELAADAAGRTMARMTIEDRAEQMRLHELRDRWSWPAIVVRFKLRAPHFEAAMAKARERR